MAGLPNPNRPLIHGTQDLAGNNLRNQGVVESIVCHVERMNDAATRSDWDEVKRLARMIILDGLLNGMPDSLANVELDDLAHTGVDKLSTAGDKHIERIMALIESARQADLERASDPHKPENDPLL